MAQTSLPSDVCNNRKTTSADSKPKAETEIKLTSQTFSSNTSSEKKSSDQKRDQSCEEMKEKDVVEGQGIVLECSTKGMS